MPTKAITMVMESEKKELEDAHIELWL